VFFFVVLLVFFFPSFVGVWFCFLCFFGWFVIRFQLVCVIGCAGVVVFFLWIYFLVVLLWFVLRLYFFNVFYELVGSCN